MLEDIFLTIIKMSGKASIAAVMIILIRLLVGRKLPKTFHYVAWVILLIRLLVPFSVATSFSIFNFIPSHGDKMHQEANMAEYEEVRVSHDLTDNESFHKPVSILNDEASINSITDNMQSQNRKVTLDNNIKEHNAIFVISCIWLSVSLILLGFCIYGYFKTLEMLKTAVLFNDNGLVKECGSKLNFNRKINVFISERIDTPVVAGIANVRIILPTFLVNKCDSKDLRYVVTHELVHIKRHDNITKLLSVVALCIHWFNPLIWISFVLSQKDMEMSCDVRVISAYKNDIRSEYAKSLLNIATKQNAFLHGGLLSFGESNIRDRIEGIMKFKKNGIWLRIFTAFMFVVLGVALLTNGQIDPIDEDISTIIDNTYLRDLPEHKDEDTVNEKNTLDENDEFSELTAHVATMEELLVNSDFQYMTEEQMELILKTLPEVIQDNYHGVGRIEKNGSGYILLTCKSSARGLPEDAISYEFSPEGINLSQLVLEDSQGNEICRFPLGMHVTYHRDKDIFFIAVGDKSPNMNQIIQIKTYQLSEYQEYIRYAKRAKERGSSIFNSGVYPQIVVYIWIDGISPVEYVPITGILAQDMKEKLDSLEKTRCDTSTLIHTGIVIHFGEESEKHYELCLLPDGSKVIHKIEDMDKVLIDNEIYDSIMDIAKTRTAWEWVELSEIYDIVRAEMRMKLSRDSQEQVQIVEDEKSLKELEDLFSNAKYCGVTGCPFTASLLLTRKDGKVITLQIATDSCDTMILGTSAGYDYGPEPRGPGLEGTVNRQEVLKRIFDQINWDPLAEL